ncbi:hypothetical protein Dimus_037207, partial [Dionaea muscipula]
LLLAHQMLRAASHEAGNISSSEQRRPKQQHASSWPSRLAEMGAASCGASIGEQRSATSDGRRAAIGAEHLLHSREQWAWASSSLLTRVAAAGEQQFSITRASPCEQRFRVAAVLVRPGSPASSSFLHVCGQLDEFPSCDQPCI